MLGIPGLTDRLVPVATPTNAGHGWSGPLPPTMGLRGAVFRTLSQLAIHHRKSPATTEGPYPPRRGPRAGDRVPDTARNLHALTAAPGYHVLLCGPSDDWESGSVSAAARGCDHLIHIHTLDASGLWGPGITHCLVRPDGYIAYRAGGTDLTGLLDHLDEWLPPSEAGNRSSAPSSA
ncbi:hypothetical protein [Streptomyces sp. NPDC005525]|uniref:aromatic-ring hydroxylase C-terminal domain-containing protein n=1 Tax=Streptomyces sp. NPDC005525 TaxID=3364720 RepID=UPI00367A786F